MAPRTITRAAPTRLSQMPQAGCAAPKASRLAAIARLTVAAPSEVAVLIGPRNSPIAEREPIETASSRLAAATGIQKENGRDAGFMGCLSVPMSLAARSARPLTGTVGS